jgi:uncharacterized protein YdhG (YjbR/CyaY superfamily)
MKDYKNVDEYLKKTPEVYHKQLHEVRKIIQEVVPDAEESIAYGMPAYKWKGLPLFYFAAMKGHLGLYPTSEPITKLHKELKNFSTSKGCVRVPWNEKVPQGIIVKLLKERKREIEVLRKA